MNPISETKKRKQLIAKLKILQHYSPGCVDSFDEEEILEKELERRLIVAGYKIRYYNLELIYNYLKQLPLEFKTVEDAIQHRMDNGLREMHELKQRRHIEWIKIVYANPHFTFHEWYGILNVTAVV